MERGASFEATPAVHVSLSSMDTLEERLKRQIAGLQAQQEALEMSTQSQLDDLEKRLPASSELKKQFEALRREMRLNDAAEAELDIAWKTSRNISRTMPATTRPSSVTAAPVTTKLGKPSHPSKAAGFTRLKAFVLKVNKFSASKKNSRHPMASGLSPYIRHRILTEKDVLKPMLSELGYSGAETFVNGVFFRAYWRGWLELHPCVWDQFTVDLAASWKELEADPEKMETWKKAVSGTTGIPAYDQWIKELKATGYLHNHARMWFASIWIFTLGLSWQTGADFFHSHLLDGDASINTLSWRWVAGGQPIMHHQTPSSDPKNSGEPPKKKARIDTPASTPRTNHADIVTPFSSLPNSPPPGDVPVVLVVTADDFCPDHVFQGRRVSKTFVLRSETSRAVYATLSPIIKEFIDGAIEDMCTRYGDKLGKVSQGDITELTKFLAGVEADVPVLIAEPPCGPVRDLLKDSLPRLTLIRRKIDEITWPHCTTGFFKFRSNIQSYIDSLGWL